MLLKDATLYQLFAAYTMKKGYDKYVYSIYDHIYFESKDNNKIYVCVIKKIERLNIPRYYIHTPVSLNDIDLLEATKADDAYLNNAISNWLSDFVNENGNCNVSLYFEENYCFRLLVNGIETKKINAKEILKEAGYDNFDTDNSSRKKKVAQNMEPITLDEIKLEKLYTFYNSANAYHQSAIIDILEILEIKELFELYLDA